MEELSPPVWASPRHSRLNGGDFAAARTHKLPCTHPHERTHERARAHTHTHSDIAEKLEASPEWRVTLTPAKPEQQGLKQVRRPLSLPVPSSPATPLIYSLHGRLRAYLLVPSSPATPLIYSLH